MVLVVLSMIVFSSAGVVASAAAFNPEKVSEGIFRGPRPAEADLRELSEAGIKTILSLESNPSVVEEEESACRSFNLAFINIPLSEMASPSKEDLQRAVDVIQKNREGGIYVHCRRGIDRTGYVIASFRILIENWTYDKAYKECCSFGHSPLVYFFWKSVLKSIYSNAPAKIKQEQHAFLSVSEVLI